MAFVIKFIKAVRNNWKKSAFAAGALAYGGNYANNKYETNKLMRAYCEEAARYGDVSISAQGKPKRILVILNPAANKRSAEKTFEKYCEPILQLAGIIIEVMKTDSEGHARRYIEELNDLPSAILVAGGDGTVSEAVTGLMRRTPKEDIPIGVLPLGRTNSIASALHKIPYNPDNVEEVRGFANSAISVVRGKTIKKDIMKIQVLGNEEDETEPPKPVFAVGLLQWGAFRDACSLRDKYWYFGSLRDYASSLFNAFSSKLTWNCEAQIIYTPPCTGCSSCYEKEAQKPHISTGRWWSKFIPKFKLGQQRAVPTIDYTKIKNEDCTKKSVLEINPTEVILTTDSDNVSKLSIRLGDFIDSGFTFIADSWNRIRKDEYKTKTEIFARTVELLPTRVTSEEKEVFYSIDNEPYEVRNIRVSIVPKAINVFSM